MYEFIDLFLHDIDTFTTTIFVVIFVIVFLVIPSVVITHNEYKRKK